VKTDGYELYKLVLSNFSGQVLISVEKEDDMEFLIVRSQSLLTQADIISIMRLFYNADERIHILTDKEGTRAMPEEFDENFGRFTTTFIHHVNNRDIILR
jgi:hypothetical protein